MTLHNIFPFQDAVRADGAPTLILDVSAVPFVDSVGLGAIVGAYVSRQKDGRTLALVGVGERVEATLRLSNLVHYFPMFPTIEAANRHCRSSRQVTSGMKASVEGAGMPGLTEEGRSLAEAPAAWPAIALGKLLADTQSKGFPRRSKRRHWNGFQPEVQ
jgi:anti-sigma B factor antagonist